MVVVTGTHKHNRWCNQLSQSPGSDGGCGMGSEVEVLGR